MLMYRNATLLAKILMRKPPLTRTAPVMEVTLVPTLAQAKEARGAADHKQEVVRILFINVNDVYAADDRVAFSQHKPPDRRRLDMMEPIQLMLSAEPPNSS